MTEKKHKFEEHLIALSESDNLDEALSEWVEIENEERHKNGHKLNRRSSLQKVNHDVLCVCQHKIKNVEYRYNQHNFECIALGTGCREKFNNFEKQNGKNKSKNPLLKKVFENGVPGDYGVIDDIHLYSQMIRQMLLDYINKNLEINNFTSLLELRKNVKDLNKVYDLNRCEIKIEKKLAEFKKDKPLWCWLLEENKQHWIKPLKIKNGF